MSNLAVRPKPPLVRTAVLAFLAITPFLYYLQVMLWRNDFVPLPYLGLLVVFAITTWWQSQNVFVSPVPVNALDVSVGMFALMNAAWVLFEIPLTGAVNALRVAIYFFVPTVLYFYVARHLDRDTVRRVFTVLRWTAVVVASELLYERYWNLALLQPAPFQLRNFEYVAVLGTGEELLQLREVGYRALGMLEHLHASATFIGLGVLAWCHRFLEKGSFRNFVVASAMFVALIASGARTALAATALAVTMLLLSEVRRERFRVPGRVVLAALGMAAAATYLMFFSPTFRDLYAPLLTGEAFGHRPFWSDIVPTEVGVWAREMRDLPLAIPFGLGPAPDSWRSQLGISSDDFFVIDIVGRYGIVGSVIFYLLVPLQFRTATRRPIAQRPVWEHRALMAALCLAVLMVTTTIHSGAIMRKALFPWLFVALGITRNLTIDDRR